MHWQQDKLVDELHSEADELMVTTQSIFPRMELHHPDQRRNQLVLKQYQIFYLQLSIWLKPLGPLLRLSQVV